VQTEIGRWHVDRLISQLAPIMIMFM